VRVDGRLNAPSADLTRAKPLAVLGFESVRNPIPNPWLSSLYLRDLLG